MDATPPTPVRLTDVRTSEPIGARQARSSTGLTAFAVGTAVGRWHDTAGGYAGTDNGDPDRITSMVIRSGGGPIDLAHDVVAARFDRVADAMRVLALLELAVPAPSPSRSHSQHMAESDDLLTSLQNRIRGRIARDLGQFDQAVTYAEHLAGSRSELIIENAVVLMSQTGLLTRDRGLVEEAIAIAHRGLPGHPDALARLTHSLALLDGTEPSQVDDLLDGDSWLGAGTLWLLCREAIDAGESTTALEHADRLRPPGPFTDAVVAAIRAAAERTWMPPTRRFASQHRAGYPLIAVDALEQIAAAAHCSGQLLDAARLLGAAEGARKSLRYAWRFHNERIAVEAARQSTIRSGDDHLVDAFACGSRLSIQEAAEYAGRTRGNRRRPRHGWEALTPTERRVVELVADGSTNVQVAERLMMSRSTVKTHLEHVYTKTGMHNRTELTAEAVRRADIEL
jgi:DNA-binding CsgD family transcriptional regulator